MDGCRMRCGRPTISWCQPPAILEVVKSAGPESLYTQRYSKGQEHTFKTDTVCNIYNFKIVHSIEFKFIYLFISYAEAALT